MTTRPLGVLSEVFLDFVDGGQPRQTDNAVQAPLSGAPQELPGVVYSGLLQPKSAGARTTAMVRLMGHFCALGETRTTIFRILSMWNEKNLPPLEPEEFEYQFNAMYQRWGAPREELTFEEEIGSVENFEDPQERIEALIHMLDGRRLPTMEYNVWRRRLKHDYGLTTREFDSMVHRMPGTDGPAVDPQAPVDVEGSAGSKP